jgi:hypothetical protein
LVEKRKSNAINSLALFLSFSFSLIFYEHPIITTMTEKLIFRASGSIRKKKQNNFSVIQNKKRWRKCLIVIAVKKWALIRNKKRTSWYITLIKAKIELHAWAQLLLLQKKNRHLAKVCCFFYHHHKSYMIIITHFFWSKKKHIHLH